jgi:hypothetical protein
MRFFRIPFSLEPEISMPKRKITFDLELAAEAKSIVALRSATAQLKTFTLAKNARIAPADPNTGTSPRTR